jgi:hypothetical protein
MLLLLIGIAALPMQVIAALGWRKIREMDPPLTLTVESLSNANVALAILIILILLVHWQPCILMMNSSVFEQDKLRWRLSGPLYCLFFIQIVVTGVTLIGCRAVNPDNHPHGIRACLRVASNNPDQPEFQDCDPIGFVEPAHYNVIALGCYVLCFVVHRICIYCDDDDTPSRPPKGSIRTSTKEIVGRDIEMATLGEPQSQRSSVLAAYEEQYQDHERQLKPPRSAQKLTPLVRDEEGAAAAVRPVPAALPTAAASSSSSAAADDEEDDGAGVFSAPSSSKATAHPRAQNTPVPKLSPPAPAKPPSPSPSSSKSSHSRSAAASEAALLAEMERLREETRKLKLEEELEALRAENVALRAKRV